MLSKISQILLLRKQLTKVKSYKKVHRNFCALPSHVNIQLGLRNFSGPSDIYFKYKIVHRNFSVPFLAVPQTFDWAAEISGTIRSLFQIQCSQRNFLCRHLAVQTFDCAAEISGAIRSLFQIQDSPWKLGWLPSYVKILFSPKNI